LGVPSIDSVHLSPLISLPASPHFIPSHPPQSSGQRVTRPHREYTNFFVKYFLEALFFSDEKQQRFTQSVIDFDQGNLSFVRVQYPYVKTDRYGLVSSPPCSLFSLFFSERAYYSPAHCKPIYPNDMSLRLLDCPSVRLSSSHLTGRMLYIFYNSCCSLSENTWIMHVQRFMYCDSVNLWYGTHFH